MEPEEINRKELMDYYGYSGRLGNLKLIQSRLTEIFNLKK